MVVTHRTLQNTIHCLLYQMEQSVYNWIHKHQPDVDMPGQLINLKSTTTMKKKKTPYIMQFI